MCVAFNYLKPHACFPPPSHTQPKTMRLIVEKATELGVASVRPVVTQNVQSSDLGSELGKLRSIAVGASEQCERLDVPAVREPVRLAQGRQHGWFQRPGPHAVVICEERGDHTRPFSRRLDEVVAAAAVAAPAGSPLR